MTDVTGSDGLKNSESDVDADSLKPSGSRKVWLFARDVLFIVVAAVLISFLIKTFLIRSFYIPSSSMEDTLQINDRIIVNQLEPELIDMSRGDVVVFEDPGSWIPFTQDDRSTFQIVVDNVLSVVGLTAPDSNDHLIKRVIGLPGDHITCCENFGNVRVNGVPLDEPYIVIPEGETDAAPSTFDVTVPDDMMWVMGDNRYNSADSLYHIDDPSGGFVPIDDVVGRAILISYPVDRWTWLDNYSVTFRGVEEGKE
jgi:signal peptidase I